MYYISHRPIYKQLSDSHAYITHMYICCTLVISFSRLSKLKNSYYFEYRKIKENLTKPSKIMKIYQNDEKS